MAHAAKKGFTLVELMVVVIIVGILASVAVPVFRGNIRKAMATEGAALLGAVLTAQRVHFVEHGVYTADEALLHVDGVGNKYFTDYGVTSADADGFTAVSTGRGDAAGISVTITYANTGGAVLSYSGL